MQYLKLLKLLYWADRESLRESGFPLTGDVPHAMEYGPVLSGIYSLIVPQAGFVPPEDAREHWAKFFERDGYDLVMIEDPGAGNLSRYDRRILGAVFQAHKDVDGFDMSHLSHDFEEWRKNWYAPTRAHRKSLRIPLEDRLAAVGRAEQAVTLAEQAQEDVEFYRAFGA